MEEAYSRMTKRGYEIGNVDVTVIAEKPRLNVEHKGVTLKQLMRGNVARLLRTDISRVGIKARTHEKVDSVGEARRSSARRPHDAAQGLSRLSIVSVRECGRVCGARAGSFRSPEQILHPARRPACFSRSVYITIGSR